MQLLIAQPSVLQAVPVALGLHEQRLHLVLSLVPVLPKSSDLVVLDGVAEIVKLQVANSLVVPLRELDVAWLHCVVEEALVTGGRDFDSVAHKMAVELHQHAAKGKVVRRYALLVVLVVCVPE